MRKNTSLRFKITLLFIGLSALILAVFSLALFTNLQLLLYENIDEVLRASDVVEILGDRLRYVMLVMAGILAACVFLGRLLVDRALKPVANVGMALRQVTHEDLSRRIDPEFTDREFRVLVREINRMIQRLEKSFSHIMEFASNVSHEIKTPLAIMKGESEIALKSRRSPEEYQRVLEGNLEEIQRMTRLVEDLLTLTKLDYRQDMLRLSKTELSGLLKVICEQGRILAGEKKITVTAAVPEGPIHISGDTLQLRRLFLNLIANAVKFNRAGGTIHVSAEKGGDCVRVSVRDSGIGISEKELPLVFNKFYRTRRFARSEEVPGAGLGLSICKTIAEKHGGHIRAESRPGEGSVFTVSFPLRGGQ